MTDSELIKKYLHTGSESAFASIVDRHIKMVYWACRRDLNDERLAEDATQNVFILLARKASVIRVRDSLAGWLFESARLVCLDIRKKEYRRLKYEREAVQMLEVQGSNTDQSERIEVSINDALSELAPSDRLIVLMRYFEELSVRDVATKLEINEEAARKRLARAVDKLRIVMQRKESAITLNALSSVLLAHASKAVPDHVSVSTHKAVSLISSQNSLTVSHAALAFKGINLVMYSAKYKLIAASIFLVLLLGGGIVIHSYLQKNKTSAAQSSAVDTVGFTDLSIASATPIQTTGSTDDHSSVDLELHRFVTAWNSGDLVGLSSLVTPTIQMMPTTDPPITQDQLIQTLTKSQQRHPGKQLSLTVLSVDVAGSSATANVRMITLNPGITSIPAGNKPDGTIQLSKINGQWLISAVLVR